MRNKLTQKQKGIIIFIIFSVGLLVIGLFSFISGLPKDPNAIYNTPKPTITEDITPNKEGGNPVQEARRVDLIMSTLTYITGFDYSLPLNKTELKNSKNYSDNVKTKIVNNYNTYDINALTAEKYIKTPSLKEWKDVSTKDDDKKGYYVYNVTAIISESKNGSPVIPTGEEKWVITIQEQSGTPVTVEYRKA